jgi:hypothetical protein
MSTDERSVWATIVATLVVPGWYFTRVLSDARNNPVSGIDYQGLLLWSIGITVGVIIVVTILLTIGHAIGANVSANVSAARSGKPVDAAEIEHEMKNLDRSDARDKEIKRLGEYVTGMVLGVCAVAPLVLAMLEKEQFWIAQSLYGAFVVAALVGSVVKLVAYRRGL